MNPVLLLIDIQNDYFRGGAMELYGAEEAAAQASRLLDHFRKRNWPRIHIRHENLRPGASFFLPGTSGADLHASVLPIAGEEILLKHFPNSFRETRLLDLLREYEAGPLIVAGMMTHMCVEAGVWAAFDHGFEVWVAEDACATRDLFLGGRKVAAEDVQTAFLAALSQVYARVLPSREILTL